MLQVKVKLEARVLFNGKFSKYLDNFWEVTVKNLSMSILSQNKGISTQLVNFSLIFRLVK